MDIKNTDFPQYRKLPNEKTFYKISDEKHFEECQRMGSRVFVYEFEAVQYPEMLKIMDMLKAESPYMECSETEYLAVRLHKK